MKPNPAPLGTWWQPISPAKKEEDRIDDKTCTIDKVSRQFCVYFERIFEYISYNCVELFLQLQYLGSLIYHPSMLCNVVHTR